MGDDREEIARLLADFNDYVRGEKINRVHIIRAAAVMSSRIKAILARAQGSGPVSPCYECGTENLIGPICGGCNPEIAAMVEGGSGPGEAVAWRPEVVAFANLMEAQLRANDHKGGWRGDTAAALHNRLLEEAEELFDALNWRSAFLGDADPERIGSEAADVANFAMMIADVCGALAATPTREA